MFYALLAIKIAIWAYLVVQSRRFRLHRAYPLVAISVVAWILGDILQLGGAWLFGITSMLYADLFFWTTALHVVLGTAALVWVYQLAGRLRIGADWHFLAVLAVLSLTELVEPSAISWKNRVLGVLFLAQAYAGLAAAVRHFLFAPHLALGRNLWAVVVQALIPFAYHAFIWTAYLFDSTVWSYSFVDSGAQLAGVAAWAILARGMDCYDAPQATGLPRVGLDWRTIHSRMIESLKSLGRISQ